jgi:chemosensory pili system protein ChpA (sensor histidine kinase/response regulator)
MATTSSAKPAEGLAANDLGPLAWVLDELRKSLDTATKALKRYVRDAELARGSDLNAVDASQLRIARQQLHQSVGALEMVGFVAPASMLRGMEAAVQKFVAKPELCSEDAANKVERASFALVGFLESLLAGRGPSAVELFSQYADVQELAGSTRIHPADLWSMPWRWMPIRGLDDAPVELDANFRGRFDKLALQVVKTADVAACAELAALSASLARQVTQHADANFKTFWRIAAGAMEAVASGSLGADLYFKRTVSRVLIQLATHAKGDMSVPDRLAQDLLFFCAQSIPQGNSPRLAEVRTAYGLDSYLPVNYTKSFYGQFDPTVLVQARKRIAQLKESWSSFTAGELSKAKPVQDQMSLLIDSIQRLLPESGQGLIVALNEVIDSTARQQRAPEPALGMEVATAILYIEASFEDFDPEDTQQAARMSHLAQRVQMVRGGAASPPLEAWMEELYRRVSDRQTMGSVVGELKQSLSELEKLMDAYFRDPQDKVLLADVPGKLTQMRGVLTVLGLDQASHAVLKMRDAVEGLMITELDIERARAAGTFDKLGNNLGALGFLIDMLSYQPVLAKKLFVYDEASGELTPLMGRTIHEPEPFVEPAMPVEMSVFGGLDMLSGSAPKAEPSRPAPLTPMLPPLVPQAPVVVDAGEVDPELLEIFLEEAREVVGNGQTAIQALRVEPNNIGEMTTLRRAFHTLKGSSRMVGLNVFGEAAWSMEQVLNSWLADQKHATADLCNLSQQAMEHHAAWIEEIAAGGGKERTAEPLRTSADAMRLHGQFVPITMSTAPAVVVEVAPEAPAAPAAESTITLDATAVDTVKIEVPADTAAHADKPAELGIDLGFDLPDLAAPAALAAGADSAGAVFAASAHPMPSLSMPLAEPVVTIATPVPPIDPVVEPVVQPIAIAPVAFEEIALDLPVLQDSPADAPTATLQEATDLDFDIELDAAPAASSTVTVSDAASSIEVSELEQASAEQAALISEDELAAFERAMMEMESGAVLSEETVQMPDGSAAMPEPVTVAPTQEPAVAADAEISGIDMQSLQALSADHWNSPPAVSASFDLPDVQTSPAANFVSEATQPMSLASSAQAEPSDLGLDLGALGSAGAASVAAAAVGATMWAPSPSALAAATPAPSAQLSVPPSSDFGGLGAYGAEEQFKAIGPLRVSLPLYNVYLNEADEWSRRLGTVLSEWAMEPKAQVPNDAVAFAHSLAGSSATVGFSALSGLARHLEHALLHMQRIEEDGAYDPHVHASLFVNTAEEIRGLLHQFAAGFLKDASPLTESDLAHCLDAPFPQEEPVVTAEADASVVDLDVLTSTPDEEKKEEKASSVGMEYTQSATEFVVTASPGSDTLSTSSAALGSALPEPEPQSKAAALAAGLGLAGAAAAVSSWALFEKSEPEVAPVQSAAQTVEPVASLTQAPVLHVRSHQVTQDEIDDEIDAVDAIDADLFEIFEEEAQELFPATSSALRQWAARPENMSARGELLRGLHTLKGSARLAGAMRLGEMAHRMESSVESIPHEGAQAADIEPLMAQLDGMQHTFDVLRNPALAQEPAKSAATVATPSAIAGPVAAPSPALASLRSFSAASTQVTPAATTRVAPGQTVRVRAQLLDRLMNQAGEVMITRARLEAELSQLRGSLTDLQGNLEKLRVQLRELDVQAESQMQTRIQQAKEADENFDPLEFDRYTRVQELTRMMAESVNDVATVQRNIQRTIESTEDDLIAQARQTRELQRDLLRTRMVEFEGISERLYRVVRQAGKDAGKQVKLDILGGTIEMDRGVLDRMTPAFEHLLRNCVAHGIESPDARTSAGKNASGEIIITLHQEGNDVSIEFRDDGAGLNLARIREKAAAQGLIGNDSQLDDTEAANLIFTPGFSTATQVTELAGRGVGMDVVRSEVVALGGRIETATSSGQGTSFKLVLPLTTAVTQVVMVRIGQMAIGVPANLVEIVRRATQKELQQAYNTGSYEFGGESLPFFWAGALLQHSAASVEPVTKTTPVAVFRSAAQRVAVHIDEVLGNQEVVVKNLGPQLSRLPGLAGMTVLASGAVALIYNPVALATVYGAQARAMSSDPAQPHMLGQTSVSSSQFGSLDPSISDAQPRELTADAPPVTPLVPANPASVSPPTVPLVLVVDDSITVRRVTQRLLQREGYRVALAADGLQALERLAEELPSVILSDIEMPRMDGFDLLRNVRADAKYKHLPTIMITSRIAEKHREHALELGANHYLGKPYNEEELLSLIRRYAREELGIESI